MLIGCDQTDGPPPFAFDQHVVGTMADNAHHPLVFPLSSQQPECSPQDVYAWSGGRAVVATCAQSERAVAEVDGRELHPSQITSTYIFPGVGEYCSRLLVLSVRITDSTAGGLMCLIPQSALFAAGSCHGDFHPAADCQQVMTGIHPVTSVASTTVPADCAGML